MLGLVVLVEADPRECLAHLAAPAADAVRFADEGDNDISLCSFVQKHFGVAGCNNLVAAVRGELGYQAVYLALAEDFEMRVRLVQKDDGTRVGVHVGENQECLLKSPPACREIEGDVVLTIFRGDFSPLLHIAGLVGR